MQNSSQAKPSDIGSWKLVRARIIVRLTEYKQDPDRITYDS